MALLYCFLNGEVQSELSKCWSRRKARRLTGHDSATSQSVFTQSMTLFNRSRKENLQTQETSKLFPLSSVKK